MAELTERKRKTFRNINVAQIVRYRLPPPGIVSILHRVSGALLIVVGMPFVLYLLQQSLTSELSFESYRAIVTHWLGKLVLLALIWAFLHHLCAGIRYLAIDVDLWIDKPAAGASAIGVLVVSLALTLVFALKLYGAF